MEERRREKDRRHLSQLIVEQYGWSHFAARRVASRLYVEFAASPKPPVEDITRGVKKSVRLQGFFARRPSSLSSHACDSMLQDWSVGSRERVG